jgi:hypothetical protein
MDLSDVALDASASRLTAVFAFATVLGRLATSLAFAGVLAFATAVSCLTAALSFAIVLSFATMFSFVCVGQAVNGSARSASYTGGVGPSRERSC